MAVEMVNKDNSGETSTTIEEEPGRWTTLTKILISVGAGSAILLRLIFPKSRVDAVTLGLLALAALPWLSNLIRSAAFGGFSIEFKQLRKRQDEQAVEQGKQANEIRQLRFLLENFANPAEFEHLSKLEQLSPFPYIRNENVPFFLRELRRLRDLRLIQGKPNKGIRSLESDGGDVKDHFEITDKGRELLQLRREISADRAS
jgi:hypothetical protein